MAFAYRVRVRAFGLGLRLGHLGRDRVRAFGSGLGLWHLHIGLGLGHLG